MLDNKVVGKSIASLRQANGMTQQKLAATLNVSHQAVSKWETGQALPDVQTMLELSRLFGVTMEQLLSGEIPESRLHPAADRASGFDIRRAAQDWVSGIGSFFKGGQSSQETAEVPQEEGSEVDESDDVETPSDAEPEEEKSAEEPRQAPPIDLNKLVAMAPFMTREGLEAFVDKYKDAMTPRVVTQLAPFLDTQKVEELLEGMEGELCWEDLRRLAPFLTRQTVDRLTLNNMERWQEAPQNIQSAAEQLGRNIQKKVSEVDFDKLGEQISSGVNRAVREAQKFGQSVAQEVSRAFGQNGSAADQTTSEENTARSAVQRAMSAAFERALQEEKWDWIADHLDKLEDEELKQKIASRAVAADKLNWVEENFADYVTAESIKKSLESGEWEYLSERMGEIDSMYHESIARAAAEQRAWDFLEENLDELKISAYASGLASAALRAGREEIAIRLAEQGLSQEDIEALAQIAIEENQGDVVEAIWGLLPSEATDRLMRNMAEQGKSDLFADLYDRFAPASVSALLIDQARAGVWELPLNFLGELNPETLAELMNAAVEQGNWPAIDEIEQYL